jgi:dCMP deaminase
MKERILIKLFFNEFYNKRVSWDKYFLILCRIIASRSTCLSKKYGAIIVKENRIISTGYNGSLSGESHCTDNGFCFKREKGNKSGDWEYCKAVHAESNAICFAAKNGLNVEGSRIYVTVTPCYSCFKLILSSGIKDIVVGGKYNPDNIYYNQKLRELISSEKVKINFREITKEDLDNITKYLLLPSDHSLIK